MILERKLPISNVSNMDFDLVPRLNEGRLTVWAILRENIDRTRCGDGYFDHVAHACRSKSQATRFAENASEDGIRWHIRRYDLVEDGGTGRAATKSKPTTANGIAMASGFYAA